VAGQQFHTNAGNDQVNSERRGGDRRGLVASEHFWTFSFLLPHSHRDVSKSKLTKGANNAWDDIDRGFDSRAPRCATEMAA
jgi:hypothetical protein